MQTIGIRGENRNTMKSQNLTEYTLQTCIVLTQEYDIN